MWKNPKMPESRIKMRIPPFVSTILTEHFAASGAENPAIDEFYEVQNC